MADSEDDDASSFLSQSEEGTPRLRGGICLLCNRDLLSERASTEPLHGCDVFKKLYLALPWTAVYILCYTALAVETGAKGHPPEAPGVSKPSSEIQYAAAQAASFSLIYTELWEHSAD